MYEIFEQLLQLHHATAYQVSKATGIAQSTLSDWKKGRSIPKTDKMQKIADYFGVSLQYLMTGSNSEPAQPDILDEIDIAFYGDYKALDDEQKAILRDMARTMRRRREEKEGK